RGAHRLDETEVAPVTRRQVLWSGDVSDALVPHLDHVLYGERDPLSVVDRDCRDGAVFEAAVDQHQRRSRLPQLRQQLTIEPRRGRDETVHLARAHRVEIDALAL